MKQHSVLLAVAATAIIAALAGCSTHSPYYDKDGPPSVGAHIESSSLPSSGKPTLYGTRYSVLANNNRSTASSAWYGILVWQAIPWQ